jgi:hypothetical protein
VYSLKNLLRNEDDKAVTAEEIEALARWDPTMSRPRRSRSR